MTVEPLLDLRGVDILPAADDHVLPPVHDIDKSFLIPSGKISRMEPTPSESLPCCFLVLIITLHHIGSPTNQLPYCCHGNLPLLLVYNSYFQKRKRRTDAFLLSKGILCIEDRDVRRRLCAAIDIINPFGVGEKGSKPLFCLMRKNGGSCRAFSNRVSIVFFHIGEGQKEVIHGRSSGNHIDFLLFN